MHQINLPEQIFQSMLNAKQIRLFNAINNLDISDKNKIKIKELFLLIIEKDEPVEKLITNELSEDDILLSNTSDEPEYDLTVGNFRDQRKDKDGNYIHYSEHYSD